MTSSQDAIRNTADDAVSSKLSASALGYYSDPFAARLAGEHGAPPRRQPLINRGTWARVAAMDRVVDDFLCEDFGGGGDGGRRRQVVSLGAGLDSRFFRFWDRATQPQKGGASSPPLPPTGAAEAAAMSALILARAPLVVNGKVINRDPPAGCADLAAATTAPAAGGDRRPWAKGVVAYFEVDFPEVVARKRKAVAGNRVLAAAVAAATAPASPIAAATASAAAASAGSPSGSGMEEGDDDDDEEEGGGAAAPRNDAAMTAASPAAAPASAAAPTAAAGRGAPLTYALVPADLRDVRGLEAGLAAAGLDPAAPTLFLAECVLVYMEPQQSAALLSWCAAGGTSSGGGGGGGGAGAGAAGPGARGPALFAAFDMVGPSDAFGQVMVANLAGRGIPLHGMAAFPDLASQGRRFCDCSFAAGDAAAAKEGLETGDVGSCGGGGGGGGGWAGGVASADMLHVYSGGAAGSTAAAQLASAAAAPPSGPSVASRAASCVDRGAVPVLDGRDRSRVERLELLDELEEWRLLMAHYCLCLAANGPEAAGTATFQRLARALGRAVTPGGSPAAIAAVSATAGAINVVPVHTAKPAIPYSVVSPDGNEKFF